MSSKSKSRRQADIRAFRSDVAKLKSLGLVSKRVDARSQRMTKYMRSQVRKFEDVLQGHAKVVHVPKRADAQRYDDRHGGAFRTKGKSVVVPVEKGERLSYRRKDKTIVGHREAYGRKLTKEYLPRVPKSSADFPRGKDITYSIPLGGGIQSFDDFRDLEAFMFPYETKPKNPYLNWQKYVIIEHAA